MTEKHTFFVPPGAFTGDRILFPEGEAQHAARVLRVQPGNEVQIVDGGGRRFLVTVDEVRRDRVTAVVSRELPGEPDIRPRVTLAVGLLKHAGRFETMLEKAVELGVARIIPLVTERTETPRLRMDRALHILVSAMKQCGRARLPGLDPPTRLAEALADRDEAARLLCHEAADPSARLATAVAALGTPESVCLLVGPEGGFSDAEVAAAGAAGFRTVSLGATRLRTETAALAAAAVVLLGSTP